MGSLNPYMVYDRSLGPAEGAVLVFAHTGKEARRLGYYAIIGLWEVGWINCASCRLDHDPHIMEQAISDEEPHVIDSPHTCPRCEKWGNKPLGPDGCDGWDCAGSSERERTVNDV